MTNPRDQTTKIIKILYRIIVPILSLVKLIRDVFQKLRGGSKTYV